MGHFRGEERKVVTRHFLFEDKPYEIKPYFKRRRNPDAAVELGRLLRRKTPGGGGRGKDLRQKCVVKAQYSNSLEAHKVQLEKYLSREGTDIDGGRAKLFGSGLEEYKENMTAKNFRVFLSPQKEGVDLKALAERFVARLEKETGYKLYWQGACHYNTAHPHAHLLINGKDKNGREVTFPRDVIRTFMRESARDIVTSQLGKRTEEDLKLEKEAELSSPRFTRLDGKLAELRGPLGEVSLAGITREEKERLRARLETLRKLKLCSWDGGYKLKEGFEDDLKSNGRYNAFLKAREELRYSKPETLKVYDGKAGEIAGRVTKIYRLDGDASDNHAVVLEALDGKAYFVPLLRAPEAWDRKTKTPLAEGEFITLKARETQQGRLSPLIYKSDTRKARRLIKEQAWAGKLVEEVQNARKVVKEKEEARERHGV